jgi:hypothetical protein
MRVLVCGGRDFGKIESEALLVARTLDALDDDHPISEMFHGGAKGADLLAATWAVARNALRRDVPRIIIHEFPADWDAHGKAAGPLRNQRMIDEGKPDLVVAFPGGSGTADCVRRARAAGIPVQEVE